MFLQGSFFYKGKKHKLSLKEAGLTWEPEGVPDLGQSALCSEIVSVWLCPRGSLSCALALPKECCHVVKGTGGLSVEICVRRNGRKWGTRVLVFLHAAMDVLVAWYHAIWTLVLKVPTRPKSLLVILNPVGGRGKAVSIFHSKVSSLFRRARIHTSEVQTEYKGHGRVLVQEELQQDDDGVIAVGGDGLVSEVVTGLFLLISSQNGVDPHSTKTELPHSNIRVGIIPSGSTDATCFATHGSSDVTTAALHIVMGDQRAVDVASLHSDGTFQRVVTSLISYGYFGDLLRSSEGLRCMGPSRYLLSGVNHVLRNPSYKATLRVRRPKDSLGTSNFGSASCNSICTVCSHLDDSGSVETDDEDWFELSGRYSIVSLAVTCCACRLTPRGVSPSAHLGDGLAHLILVSGSSRAKLLSYLYHTSCTGQAENLSHVETIRTNEIQFNADSDVMSLFNCDGEEFYASSLNIKIHRQKLVLFCRGVEDPAPTASSKYKTTQS